MRRHTLKENVISGSIGGALGLLLIVSVVIPSRANIEKPTVSPEVLREEYRRIFEEEQEKASSEVAITIINPAANAQYLDSSLTTDNEIAEDVSASTEIEEKNVKAKTEEYLNHTETDIYLVGNTIFHEVGIFFETLSKDEAERAAYLTASCLVNRAKMNYFDLGENIKSQIVPSQYASASKITSSKEPYVPERIYEIAEDVLQNGPVVSDTLVFQSEFKQGKNVEKIGNQYFGVLPE